VIAPPVDVECGFDARATGADARIDSGGAAFAVEGFSVEPQAL